MKRDAARRQFSDGSDPARAKQDARLAARLGAANTFEAVAEEYINKMEQEGRASATVSKVRWLLYLIEARAWRTADCRHYTTRASGGSQAD